MDTRQITRSLLQVLENYRRCGLSRFERLSWDQLDESLRERLSESIAMGAENYLPAPEIAASASPASASPASASPASASPASASAGSSTAPSPPGSSPTRVSSPTQAVAELGRGVSGASMADEPRGGGSSAGPLAPAATIGGGSSWTLPVLEVDQRQRQLGELQQQVEACRLCADIVHFRQQIVFGSGPPTPTICFMGEAPGADEDRTGEPFVGKAGQLLSKIIVAMKLRREEVYILNALRCRPPQNRTPVPDEINSCRHFVAAQLDILQPKYIVCLGSVAVQSLLQSTLPIGRLRGKFHQYQGAKVVVTYHPSYLLRNESAKRMVWEDMQMLMREIGSL